MRKSTPFSIRRDLKGNPQLAGYGALTIMASFHPAGFLSDEAMEKTAAELVIAGNSHESLVAALQLVKQGLETGNVRAKPIIEMDFEAESAPIRTLDEIVDAALKLAGAA